MKVAGSCGAYIDAVSRRQATLEPPSPTGARNQIESYENFTKINPI